MSTASLELSELLLDGRDAHKHHADLLTAMVSNQATQTITGASTFEIVLADEAWTLTRSTIVGQRSRLVIDRAGFTLVSVKRNRGRVTLTFEDDAVAELRTHMSVRKAAAGTTTRPDFVRSLIRDVPDLKVVVAPGVSKNLVELSRGSGGTNSAGDVIPTRKEDTWAAAGRIMGEIGWRVFCHRGTITIAPDSWLLTHSGNPYSLTPGTSGVIDIDFDFDVGKPAATATVTAFAGFHDLTPGSPVKLGQVGPADGTWLVETIRRTTSSKQVTVDLVRPQPVLPEPKGQDTGGDFGIPAFLPDYMGDQSSTGGGGSSPSAPIGVPHDEGSPTLTDRFVSIALQQRGKPYVYGASGPNAWDCCLTGDMLISGPNGPRRIDEIQSGDVVFTRNATGILEEKKVIKAWRSKDQETFRVKMRGRHVDASANHPFLRLTKVSEWKSGNDRIAARYEPEWVRLDQLKRGDLLVVLDQAPDNGDPVPVLPDGRLVTPTTAWLLGAIVGDGTVSKNQADVRVAAFGGFQDECISAFQEAFGVTKHLVNATSGVIVWDRQLARTLWGMGFWRRGAEKRVPEAVWGWSRELQLAFAAGFAAADGSVGRDGQAYCNTSRQLIDEIRQIHILAGHRVSNVTTNKRTKPITIKGKLVKKALPLHAFVVSGLEREKYVGMVSGATDVVRRFTGGNFGVRRVQGIEPLGVQATYDLEIEDNHNFVADGVVVHNSGFVQWCAKQVGLSFAKPVSSQAAICRKRGTTLTVDQAARTKGALLFRQRGGGAHDHVVISLGDGSTIEAMGRAYGVVIGKVSGRDWTSGGYVPGLAVDAPSPYRNHKPI